MGVVISREINEGILTFSPSYGPLPHDEFPYPGPAVLYKIFHSNVKMKEQTRSVFHSQQTSESELFSYYRMLQEKYNEHLRMKTFLRVPMAASRLGYVPEIPCLAVFCDSDSLYAKKKFSRYRLVVDQIKVKLENLLDGPEVLSRNVAADDVMKPIAENIITHTQSDDGGKLICAEITSNIIGQGRKGSSSPSYVVDMMYEFPMHSRPTQYVYIAYVTPMYIAYENDEIISDCNFASILPAYLDQGWRLVDILIAQQQLTFDESCAKPGKLNMICFFEKRKEDRADPTPKYEIKIVDYFMIVRSHNGEVVHISIDLSALLEDMGIMGWKLACILDVPEMKRLSDSRSKKKISLFFQRKIRERDASPIYLLSQRNAKKRRKKDKVHVKHTALDTVLSVFHYSKKTRRRSSILEPAPPPPSD